MNNPSELSEAEETRRGELLIEMLGLKPVGRNHHEWGMSPPRYNTTWGTKTALGLFRSVSRLILDGE